MLTARNYRFVSSLYVLTSALFGTERAVRADACNEAHCQDTCERVAGLPFAGCVGEGCACTCEGLILPNGSCS